jgi:hypothetical protein
MPRCDGIEAARRVLAATPDVARRGSGSLLKVAPPEAGRRGLTKLGLRDRVQGWRSRSVAAWCR